MKREIRDEIEAGNYLQSLMLIGRNREILSASELNQIQAKLFDLLITVAESTGGKRAYELSMDQTEQLLASICYQISYGLKKESNIEEQMKELKKMELSTLYQQGHELLRREFESLKSTYDGLRNQRLSIDNQAYEDTYTKGIKEFFDTYDLVGKAHELPGFFDYPLCNEGKEVTGLSYVKEYLEALQEEESFCHLFEENRLQALLNGYSKSSRQLVVNLYEMVVANVIGNMMINQSWHQVMELTIGEKERKQLEKMIHDIGLMELESLACDKMKEFLDACKISKDSTLRTYVLASIPKVIYRCNQNARNHTLECFFVTLEEVVTSENTEYVSENPMPEEELNQLIFELKECRYPSDKLSLIRKKVRNVEDLMTVLATCVYGEEAKELFLQLNNQELAALMAQVLKESESTDCYNYDGSTNWHMELILTINEFDGKRQEDINELVRKLIK